MGMFDNIEVETTLIELPQDLAIAWKERGLVFQTKDTPNQSMATYKIDGDGQLWIEKTEGHWEEGKEIPENASFIEKLAAHGKFVVDETWWEKESFKGVIKFGEIYNHSDYYKIDIDAIIDKSIRFEYGWIEYRALFNDGKLIEDIELIEHKEPKKLSDEELEERKDQHKKNKEKSETFLKEHRKNSPSAEQKLIDNIDRECKLAETIMDEEDASIALSNIRILIQQYRKIYDHWYTQP